MRRDPVHLDQLPGFPVAGDHKQRVDDQVDGRILADQLGVDGVHEERHVVRDDDRRRCCPPRPRWRFSPGPAAGPRRPRGGSPPGRQHILRIGCGRPPRLGAGSSPPGNLHGLQWQGADPPRWIQTTSTNASITRLMLHLCSSYGEPNPLADASLWKKIQRIWRFCWTDAQTNSAMRGRELRLRGTPPAAMSLRSSAASAAALSAGRNALMLRRRAVPLPGIPQLAFGRPAHSGGPDLVHHHHGRGLGNRDLQFGQAADQPRHAHRISRPDGEDGVRQLQAPQGGGVPPRRHRVKAEFFIRFEAEAGIHDHDVGDLPRPFQHQRQGCCPEFGPPVRPGDAGQYPESPELGCHRSGHPAAARRHPAAPGPQAGRPAPARPIHPAVPGRPRRSPRSCRRQPGGRICLPPPVPPPCSRRRGSGRAIRPDPRPR